MWMLVMKAKSECFISMSVRKSALDYFMDLTTEAVRGYKRRDSLLKESLDRPVGHGRLSYSPWLCEYTEAQKQWFRGLSYMPALNVIL
uniref:Uncharacterized protein n=1 Tax=Hyaloperonospora arabidopsidis (strain Emoy2) TaxID=559515 RepID=M4C4X7_HYAAE